MTRAEGSPDPGDPSATDEEAVDAKFVQADPMSPEAEAVAVGVDHLEAADVEAAVADKADIQDGVDDVRKGGSE